MEKCDVGVKEEEEEEEEKKKNRIPYALNHIKKVKAYLGKQGLRHSIQIRGVKFPKHTGLIKIQRK